MPDSQPDVSELARKVVDELEDRRQIGDQLLLSRREAIALSTGAVSLGALGVAGAGTASAEEAAGQIGSDSERVNIFANELDVNNLTLDEAIELVDGDVDFGSNDINNFGTASGEALEAGKIRTAPTGTIVTLDGNQTIPDDTFVDLEWSVESPRGNVSDLLDASDNVVVVPEGFDYARVNINIFFDDFDSAPHTIDRLVPQINGSSADEGWRGLQQSEITVRSYQMGTGWSPVDDGDEISVEFTQISEEERELRSGFDFTFMEVWLL